MKNIIYVLLVLVSLSCNNNEEPPPPPSNIVATDATLITQTSFEANWSASSDATDYLLDVSTSDTYDSFVPGYNTLSVGNVTSYTVDAGITEGTMYYYRVRASNITATTPISNTISLITIPPDPIAKEATNQTQVSFDANWESSTGATDYLLDVSTSETFDSFVSGFDGLSVGDVTSHTVSTDLIIGSTFYYRIRALNESGESSSSNTISLIIFEAWDWELWFTNNWVHSITDHPIVVNPEEYLEVQYQISSLYPHRMIFNHHNRPDRKYPLAIGNNFTFTVDGLSYFADRNKDDFNDVMLVFMNEIINLRDVLVTVSMYINGSGDQYFDTDVKVVARGFPLQE